MIARSKDSKRNDDNIETLKKRLGGFIADTMPIVNLYKERG